MTDHFKEEPFTSSTLRNCNQTTLGAFVQNTWNTSDWLTIETGLRGDYVKDYGFALLPRVSALFKIQKGLSSRIGAGLFSAMPGLHVEGNNTIQRPGCKEHQQTVNDRAAC